MILVILGTGLKELVHEVGAWMFCFTSFQERGTMMVSEPGPRGGEDVWFVGWRVVVGQLESLAQGRVRFLVCRFFEEEQLFVTSCWALSKPFFLSEPPVSFSANGGANFYHEVVVRIK